MPTQCLASCFSCQEISRIFDIQESWQLFLARFTRFLRDFSRSWKEIQEKFWFYWKENKKKSKILAREQRKVLGFLAKRNLGFLRFLAKILAINLGKSCKSLQDFSRFWKEIHKIFLDFFARKSRIIKILARESCNQVLHQSTTRSIDILSAIILKNSKKGLLLLRVLFSETELSLTNKN